MRWNRIRRSWALVVALFLFSVAGVGFLAASSSSSIAEVLRDPLSVLSERSPGGRGAGALFNTKPVKGKALSQARGGPGGPVTPSERVLPVTRERPAGFVAPPSDWLDTPLALGPGPDGLLPGDAPAVPGMPIGSPPPFGRPPLSGCCGIATPDEPTEPEPAPSPTPDPGPTPTPTGTPPTTPEPPAVPEPATWAMLILGFFAAGSALRRQVRREGMLRAGATAPSQG